MKSIENDILIEAYQKAKELKLDHDFIALLHQELLRRNLVCQDTVVTK
ncbi:sporulation histidine kinase inhibitor Sda [Halalkalibacterium ligniniphilum]|nr:sporulation histidine kinase inhibitor Sda [Halalkalibacterium ligniniphilum]